MPGINTNFNFNQRPYLAKNEPKTNRVYEAPKIQSAEERLKQFEEKAYTSTSVVKNEVNGAETSSTPEYIDFDNGEDESISDNSPLPAIVNDTEVYISFKKLAV